jgi:hypothetical protein
MSSSAGYLFFTEFDSHTVWRLTSVGTGQLIAGSGQPSFADGIGSAASFAKPYHLGWFSDSIDGEALYIADSGNDPECGLLKFTPWRVEMADRMNRENQKVWQSRARA